MSQPEGLHCTWFRYTVPFCACPYKPPICEQEQITEQDTDNRRVYESGQTSDRSNRSEA